MELLGVVFLEEKVSDDLRYSISKLNSCGINLWMVSGDCIENVIGVARNLDMYKEGGVSIVFNENDDADDLDITMNLNLLQLIGSKDLMMKMKTLRGLDINMETTKKAKTKDLTIIIHGRCFDLICSDQRLYQCFTILLCFTNTLLGHAFTAKNKFVLCQMMKKYVTKNSKVLAIGDGLNDFMMLKEADLSIGIRSREILQVSNTCDVIVSKFPQIVDLILVHGTWNMNRVYSILFFSIYANVLIICPYFLAQMSSQLGSSFFTTDYLKLSLDLLVINLVVILTISMDQFVDRSLIGLNSNVYLENFNTNGYILKKFFKKIISGIIDSVIIYFFFYNMINNTFNILGEETDLNVFTSYIHSTAIALIYIKVILLFIFSFYH